MLFFNSNRPKSDVSLRRFVSPIDIRTQLEKKYEGEAFPLEQFLLIFDTATQHTWIVASDKNLLCIVDRRKEDSLKLLWRMPIEEITHNGALSIEIEAEETVAGTGYVKIGRQRIRKFSTSLFSAEELKQQIENLLRHRTSDRVPEVQTL